MIKTRNIKVLITLQQYFEVEFTDCYSEAETYIIEIPEEQGNIVDNLSRVFNAADNVFREVLSVYSYTEGMERQYFTKLKGYWTSLAKNVMRGSNEVQLIKSVGWDRIERVVSETLSSMDKSLVNLVCRLYNWRVVTKLPCVIDKVVSIIIEN